MKPDEQSSDQGGLSLPRQAPQPIDTKQQTPTTPTSNEAAANVIRTQIDNIYNSNEQKQQQTDPTDIDPYDKTHSPAQLTQINNWKDYHTAWQNYYQKYYEGFYTHHYKKARAALEEQAKNQQKKAGYFSESNTLKPDEEPISKEDAIFDIRQGLIKKIATSSNKIRKSRHFIPILSGLIVVLIFLFLQFNQLIIANVMAYVSPGNIDPQNVIIDPNADLTVPPGNKLIIPKINVDVPILFDVGNDTESQLAAMTKGVAQFAIPGASSHPGEVGNTVIAGHSSNDLFDSGDYKFIFAQLDKLSPGDTVYINYNTKRYTYTVTKKTVVNPNDVQALVYPTTKPILTLVTCVPLGTALNRLLVTAEQVSPNPGDSAKAPAENRPQTTSMPGTSPSFLERLFSGKW